MTRAILVLGGIICAVGLFLMLADQRDLGSALIGLTIPTLLAVMFRYLHRTKEDMPGGAMMLSGGSLIFIGLWATVVVDSKIGFACTLFGVPVFVGGCLQYLGGEAENQKSLAGPAMFAGSMLMCFGVVIMSAVRPEISASLGLIGAALLGIGCYRYLDGDPPQPTSEQTARR